MRLSRCEVRDHINCRKNDRWRSHRFYRALQRLKSPMRFICEIFGAPQFSSFSTQSALLGPGVTCDLSLQSAAKRTGIKRAINLVYAARLRSFLQRQVDPMRVVQHHRQLMQLRIPKALLLDRQHRRQHVVAVVAGAAVALLHKAELVGH